MVSQISIFTKKLTWSYSKEKSKLVIVKCTKLFKTNNLHNSKTIRKVIMSS